MRGVFVVLGAVVAFALLAVADDGLVLAGWEVAWRSGDSWTYHVTSWEIPGPYTMLPYHGDYTLTMTVAGGEWMDPGPPGVQTWVWTLLVEHDRYGFPWSMEETLYVLEGVDVVRWPLPTLFLWYDVTYRPEQGAAQVGLVWDRASPALWEQRAPIESAGVVVGEIYHRVVVEPLGMATVEVSGSPVEAKGFRYRAETRVELAGRSPTVRVHQGTAWGSDTARNWVLIEGTEAVNNHVIREYRLELTAHSAGVGVGMEGTWTPGPIKPGMGWIYQAEVTDPTRERVLTTTLTFVCVSEPGKRAFVVIVDRDEYATVSVVPVFPDTGLARGDIQLDQRALRWPTVLDFVPELRGAMPPVQGVAIPAVSVEELEWSLSFRMRLDGGQVERGEIRLVLGPQGEVTVGAGTFVGLYSTTYFASWGRMSHEGMAWWPGEGDTAGPAWIPVRAQGTLGTGLQYTWALMEQVFLSTDELKARLREALSAMEKTDPAGAREVRDTLGELGIEVP